MYRVVFSFVYIVEIDNAGLLISEFLTTKNVMYFSNIDYSITLTEFHFETVFFLSSLLEDIYSKVLKVMESYRRLELKGRRATIKQLKEGRHEKTVDCPCYNFKCLCGDLTESEIRDLLTDPEEGNMSFAGKTH